MSPSAISLRDGEVGKQAEDLIELQGSRNEVHNLVIDMRGHPTAGSFNLSSAISAKAEDDEFYDAIVFSHILVRGVITNVGTSRKANAVFEYITSLDTGFVGINPIGNGNVEVRKVHFARKAVGVCFLSLWEHPREENGPSILTGALKDSKLRDGSGQLGFLRGVGLLVVGRGGRVSRAEPVAIVLDVIGNAFQANNPGVSVVPKEPAIPGPPPIITAETHIDLRFRGNTIKCWKFNGLQLHTSS